VVAWPGVEASRKGGVVFGISGTELVLIAVFVLIIFGPDKIPEIARTVGKAVATFKRVQEDTERIIKAEMFSSDSDAGDSAAVSSESIATESAESASMASSLYAANDDDDEEEEE
jgi:TatA/E family protein of Tat protein translocase